MPSAVVLSILIHAGLFLLAGLFVVFTILPPKETAFEPPPPVKKPKMPLRKIQLKVKKPSKPKASAKLTAIVKKPDLHEIAFPDLPTGGMGSGIGGDDGVVSFIDLPSFEDEDGILGKEKSIGNDLEGTYYDFKRNSSGSYNGVGGRGAANATPYLDAVNRFFNSGWKTTSLSRYYKSPTKRYASFVVVPTMSSSVAPSAFGEDRGSGIYWMVIYRGQIVHPEDITFRFWGAGDHFLGVRVNKEVVFFTAWQYERNDFNIDWKSNNSQRATYFFGYDTLLDVGDWITLKAGEPQDIEIAMGDNGGLCALALLVEVKGKEYPQNEQGGPILPVFKTEELTHAQMDAIYKDLYVDDCSLTNGPVFRDY